MQLTQSISSYCIPTAFIQHFNLGALTSELKGLFPHLVVDEKEKGPLTSHDYTHLKNLLENISKSTSSALKSNALYAEVINKMRGALDNFAATLLTAAPAQAPHTAQAASNNTQVEKKPTVLEVDHVLVQQLQTLIQTSELLSASKTASLQALLDLSWGIANIPKGKKFSKRWGTVISEHHLLLLEDISRQMSQRFSTYPCLSNQNATESQQLVSRFSDSAKTLKVVFEILKELENHPSSKPPAKPLELPEIEALFYPNFDFFVLEQVEHHMQVLMTALGSQDAVQWLRKSPIHIKVLFRTIEVMGEASKILSKKTKQQLPTLTLSSPNKQEKPLWGKLRNQLHHNKNRSWDIANFAPEKWAVVLTDLFPQLQAEMRNYKNQTGVPIMTYSKAENVAKLEKLSELCGQDQFREVRKAWHSIKEDFQSEPRQLTRILFGFESASEHEFLQVWEIYAKPHLKQSVDEHQNQNKIFEMLRVGRGNLIENADIEKLMPSTTFENKQSAIAEMKRLLLTVSPVNDPKKNKELKKAFEKICRQFVFLKHEIASSQAASSSDTTSQKMIERDAEKNEALKKLMLQRLSQIFSYPFSAATFKKSDHSPTEYGELMICYIQLKHHRISHLMVEMRKALNEIQTSWPEQEVNVDNVQSLGVCSRNKACPKKMFMDCLRELRKEQSFVTLPSEEDLDEKLKKLKTFPASRIFQYFQPAQKSTTKKKKSAPEAQPSIDKQQLVDEINASKKDCLTAVAALTEVLNQITYSESEIQARVQTKLNKAITLFETIMHPSTPSSPDTSKQQFQEVKQIFTDFAFTDTSTFIQQLNRANITHSLTLTENTLHLITLPSKVLASLESQLEADLDKKVDELVSSAEDDLSTSYVQKALLFNIMPISVSPKSQVDARLHVAVLRDIYKLGLDGKAGDYLEKIMAWENIERKIGGFRLLAREIHEVLSWLPSDNSIKNNKAYPNKAYPKVQNDLLEYLNGVKGFALENLPRFEHTHKKIEIFENFLVNECFVAFPSLKDKKDKLMTYFKAAYGIVDTQSKAEGFSSQFVRKIKNLGTIFSKIREEENTPTSPSLTSFLLLSAEYDMQDIGELAQLITDRPALWDFGRHILSSQHLLWISLMRKMMAHYPLLLAAPIMRWNLEYLAFDTDHVLSSTSPHPGVPYSTEMIKTSKRKLISAADLQKKLFDIENHLDSLNLNIQLDVLYPSLHLLKQTYLHPFGDLGLMVYPNSDNQSKTDFIHAVMELELILSYEFDAKVSVIGEWNKEFVNVPSAQYIPKDYLERMIDNKQMVYYWINSNKIYELFLNKPWSQVHYTSGIKVTRSDFEFYHDLVFFLNILEFQVGRDPLESFVNSPGLDYHIHSMLHKQLSALKTSPYAESELFKWICCLFERFCPPEITPCYPIQWPKAYEDARRIATLLDENGKAIQFLPENIEEYDEDKSKIAYYYRGGIRMDILNGRSLLDPSDPISDDELYVIAEYAASVLKSHVDYILEKLKPENELSPSQFTHIKSIKILDPVLVEESSLTDIPFDIEQLIDKEARTLERKITSMVAKFCRDHGLDFCVQMLEWIKVDKEIAVIARDYYGKNRLRLKGPYIELDEISRHFFDHLFVIDSLEFGRFSSVANFRQLLNRIHMETRSLAVESDFSAAFKSLVPESDIQKVLLNLMKRREVIMQLALKAFLKKHPEFYVGLPENSINNFYLKWDQLFRMINRPQVFEVLKSNSHDLVNTQNRHQLLTELKEDFKEQYQTPGAEREETLVRTSDQEKRLFNARSYFKGKKDTHVAKSQHEEFMKPIANSAARTLFLEDWEKQFGEPFAPFYYENLIVETREALDHLIRLGSFPDYDFQDIPTYSDYWEFVNTQDKITLTSLCMGSGLDEAFKLFMLGGGSFEQIKNDPTKRQELEQNKKLSKLVEAYVGFFNLENALSNYSYYLKLHQESHVQLTQKKQEAEQLKKENWRISEYNERITTEQYCLEKACLKLEEILIKITQTEFFTMLKLEARRQSLFENPEKALSEQEQEKQVWLRLQDESIFNTLNFSNFLTGIGIKPGKCLEVFLNFYKFKNQF